jgi:hypothetical protein
MKRDPLNFVAQEYAQPNIIQFVLLMVICTVNLTLTVLCMPTTIVIALKTVQVNQSSIDESEFILTN